MEELTPNEKVQVYFDTLAPALENLKQAFLLVVNEKGDISKFQEAIRELDNARQFINSMGNIGIVIGIERYLIATFPLSGDPVRDLGQSRIDLPEA